MAGKFGFCGRSLWKASLNCDSKGRVLSMRSQVQGQAIRLRNSGFADTRRRSIFVKEGIGVNEQMLVAVLGAAALSDVRWRRVPNWLIAVGMAMGIACRGGPFASSSLLAALAAFPLFYLRMAGGGDVKLMALICGYLGLSGGLLVISHGYLAGAVWALLKLVRQGLLLERISYFIAWFRQTILLKQRIAYFVPERDGYGVTIPMAACFLMGALIRLWPLL